MAEPIEPAPRPKRESGLPETKGGWFALATLAILLIVGFCLFLIHEREAGMLLLSTGVGFAVGRASKGG